MPILLCVDIDHDGPLQVYLQLAAILRGQIGSGELPAGRALPARDRIAAEYGVSRGTVERAVAVLRAEGLVATTPGRGVFVTPPGGSGSSPPSGTHPRQ